MNLIVKVLDDTDLGCDRGEDVGIDRWYPILDLGNCELRFARPCTHDKLEIPT